MVSHDTTWFGCGLSQEKFSDVQIMSCPLESQHVGKELLNTLVQLPIDAVFTLLFVQEQFMIDVYQAKKTTEVTATSWQEQEDGCKTRQMTYTMTLPPSNISPKYSYVTENQTLLPQSNPGSTYIVEAEVINSGIPYADSFTVIKHCCIIKQEDGRTGVVVWVSVKFKKTVWGFVKNMIEKNTYSGVEGVFQEVFNLLTAEAERISNPSAVGKKRHRQPGAQSKARSHSPRRPLPNKKTHKQDKSASIWLVILMMVAVTVLAFGNVFIYKKLCFLEEMSGLRNSGAIIPSVRYLGVGGSWEDVARILQKQQVVHNTQVEVWKSKLAKASVDLLEIQESLEWIVENIREHEIELEAILKQQSENVKNQWSEAELEVENKLFQLMEEPNTQF